jgi:dienelactone hydrolase
MTGCSRDGEAGFGCTRSISGFKCVDGFARTVLRTEPAAGPAVILLHELPGMSPADMELARRIAHQGFTVYLPLLFGEPGQDSFISGYFQSCAYGEFECAALSKSSPALKWLETVCDQVVDLSGKPIGVIGMCLTGVFPLALLRAGVEAAVVCQPTLPFNLLFGKPIGRQKEDVGLDKTHLDKAAQSTVPLLAMRYASDKLCPPERMQKLRSIFHQRLASIEIEGKKGHSTLADSFDAQAFADTINYLRVMLGVERGPKLMSIAKLGRKNCEITADRIWRAL